MTGIWKLSVEL